jgi:hypothetical protein
LGDVHLAETQPRCSLKETRFSDVFGSPPAPAHSQRAFVVSSDLQFGMARMFGIYRESACEKGITIFRDMKEALAWLSLSMEPDPKVFAHLGSAMAEAP